MCALQREELLPGIFFSSISDDRFKTNRMTIQLVAPLKKETAALHALLPNVLRKNYKAYPDFTAFNHYLSELYGAYVDGGVDKWGDEQLVSLTISGIDNRFTLENENITESIATVLTGLLLEPVLVEGELSANEINLEKVTLIDAIHAEINDKRSYALNSAVKLLCQNEPYGLSKYGTMEEVEGITPKALTDAYRNLLKTSRIELIFGGSGCVETAKAVFQKSFAKLSRNFEEDSSTKPHEPTGKLLNQVEKVDVNQSKMVLGFSAGASWSKEQIPASILMSTILGGTPMSKLFLNVREKLSLCYYCAARLDGRKGLLTIDCGVENANIEQARVEILNQVEQMQLGNFTDEDIKNAVMSVENSYRTTNDSNSSIMTYYLGQIMSGQIRTPEENAARIQAVTRAQLIEAAKLLQLELVYVLTSKGEVV